jgi:NAD(P)H-quinone oxidoreductase subunit 4L
VTVQTVLVLGAVLIGIGLYGALSRQSVVMLMMGLELMLSGVIAAAAGVWHFLAPDTADGQVLVVVVVCAMAMEMAVGFGVVLALYRCRQVDTSDLAAEMKG